MSAYDVLQHSRSCRRLKRHLSLELARIEVVIKATLYQQSCMRTTFDNLAILDDKHQVCVADSGESARFFWFRVFSAHKQSPCPPWLSTNEVVLRHRHRYLKGAVRAQTATKKRPTSHRSLFIPIPNFQPPFPLPPKFLPILPAPSSRCDRDTADDPRRDARRACESLRAPSASLCRA